MNGSPNNESARRSLIALAKRLFEERFGRDGELERELTKFEKYKLGAQQRQLELKAQIKAKSIYAQRLANFIPFRRGEFLCPKCWLMEEVASGLSEHPVGHARFSQTFEFRCPRCRDTFPV